MIRLLGAFLVVSLAPIGVLAFLSFQESRALTADHTESGSDEHAGETLFGLSIATVELIVAGASLGFSALMALYVGRTIVSPIRELEASMTRVEGGDLDATTPVRSADELGRLAVSFNKMVQGLRREAFIRDLFGQYVTPELASVAIEQKVSWRGNWSQARSSSAISEISPGCPRLCRHRT